MTANALEHVIAERALTLIDENGNSRTLSVTLGRPEQSSENEYCCPFRIVGLGDERVEKIYGMDAFQALQLTLRFIAFRLNRYRKESKSEVYWCERGDDMGFPEPPPQ
jgi:hypothetical protein